MNTKLCRQLASLSNQDQAHDFPESTNYRAPHQALLLLVVFELFQENPEHAPLIPFNSRIRSRWLQLFNHVMGRPSELQLPFFAMNEYSFWNLKTRKGQQVKKCRTFKDFDAMCEGASLSSDLHQALKNADERIHLCKLVIETHFHPCIWCTLSNQLVTFKS